MMKKFTLILLCFMLLFALSVPAFAADDEGAFTTVKVKVGELNWPENKYTILRYDDGMPIAMCTYFDDHLYGIVPAANLERGISAFAAEPLVFTDLDPESYEAFVMEDISMRGIIEGYEGKARPNDPVRRSEAVAIVLRMVGLDSLTASEKAGFKDVPADAWYAKDVDLAYEWGIITGDSADKFSPDRSVSRQEFTAMAARALVAAEMHVFDKDADREDILIACPTLQDADKIYDYALPAYKMLARNILMDEVEVPMGDKEPEYIYYAYPAQAATRYECALLAYNIVRFMQVYPVELAEKYGFDKAMPVIDGSTSSYPLTNAVYNMLFYNGWNHDSKPAAHSKSHTSYQRLINGEADILFAAVPPSQDIKDMAAAAGVELELIPIALDAMIFFTNADNEIDNITTEQLHEIYAHNAYKNWNEVGGPDALLYPYCRNTTSGSHALMEQYILDGEQIDAAVALEESGTMSSILTDVMAAQTEDPLGYGLGYSLYYYFQNMELFYDTYLLKLLAIDGVAPSPKTIADGSYPLQNNTYAVILADSPEDSLGRKMVEFMLSKEGQICVNNAGFGAL